MPEEKKKDSFTFSDKIKDSKQPASKSFANRISSKIGRDGKPKQTIFERTKRDAPFLIAALVALLLLPFLYKFSGSVSDEPMITPGSEESVFDPERYAFAPDVETPEGQISQLSGRDSLSLIKGYGDEEEANEGDEDMYRGAYEGRYDSSADSARSAASDTNVDIEENTTNIYKKRAKAATRAAFRRATKINGLPNATKTRGNGEKLAVGNWGGRMKEAAKRVKGDTPKSSPKPVSLQPLQAAAKPNRTAFGNTAAAQRQSKDALGKGDAKQAIMDAMVKPVEPGSFGGLTMGDSAFGGGGADLKREFNYNGKEPWWWDLMKTRSQKLWERYWERKWKWEDWLDDLAMHILGGVINCLVTGDDDGDMGSMFGSGAGGGGSSETCCGKKASYFKKKEWADYIAKNGLKNFCDGSYKDELKKNGLDCSRGYKGGTASGERKGFFSSRLACLGIAGSKYAGLEASITESSSGQPCVDLNTSKPPRYSIMLEGKAQKWRNHVYHWIVARNYVPLTLANKDGRISGKKDQKLLLCSKYVGNNLQFSKYSTAGFASIHNMPQEDVAKFQAAQMAKQEIARLKKEGKPVPAELEERAAAADVTATDIQNRKDALKDYSFRGNAYAHANYKDNPEQLKLAQEIDVEDLNNACVIYLANGPVLDWELFKQQAIQGLSDLIKKQGFASAENDVQALAENAFNQLDLFFIEGMATEKKLGYAKWGQTGNAFRCTEKMAEDGQCMLPMPYWDFFEAYVERSGSTTINGSKNKVYKRKQRTEGEDRALGAKCYFDGSITVDCPPEQDSMSAIVTFGPRYKGGIAQQEGFDPVAEAQSALNVKAQLKQDGGAGYARDMVAPMRIIDIPNAVKYNLLADRAKLPSTGTIKDGLPGNIIWTIERKGNNAGVVQTVSCPFNNTGDTNNEGVQECTDPNSSPKCCLELKGSDYEWVEGKCQLKRRVPPPQTGEKITRLAPVISFVSKDPTNRLPVVGDPKKEHFGNDLIPPAQNDPSPYQHCGIPESLVMNSDSAANFIKKVVKKYNEAYAAEIANGAMPKLSDVFMAGDYPNDAEFIDALNIAADPKVNELQVPASAVCELGRDMVRMSRDYHVGDKKVPTRNHNFRNELGAFLAYVHPASILYPATRHWGQCDERFQSKLSGDGGCGTIAKANNVPNAYHHNNFNNISVGQIYTKHYEPSLRKLGIITSDKAFPLQELADVNPSCKAFNNKYQNCGQCNAQVNAYNKNAGCALMYRDTNEGVGQACVAFAGNAQMSVENALKYVQNVCKAGLDQKPFGARRRNNSGSYDETIIAPPKMHTKGPSSNEGV